MQNLIPIADSKDVNTADDVRHYFETHGISRAKWCKENNISPNVVKNLLSKTKRGKGVRGNTHHAAIALGMKLPPTDLAHAVSKVK